MIFLCKPAQRSNISLGAMYEIVSDGIWNHDCLLVFHRYFSSIKHRFRQNQVFLQTGNIVIIVSPPEGAAYSFQWWILNDWVSDFPTSYLCPTETLPLSCTVCMIDANFQWNTNRKPWSLSESDIWICVYQVIGKVRQTADETSNT